eukprot:Skav205487  [mRNA]  locus=scaffold830:468004:477239:- [translate_table: standard]
MTPGLAFFYGGLVKDTSMFAVITPALMTGAFADRFRFKPYLIFIVLWLLREIPEHEKEHHKKPHNVPFVALGTALLWFGWFGFNPGRVRGSALASNGAAVAAAVNSEIAASVSTFLWLLIEWIRMGRPSLVGLCVGAIGGLATITPAAGFIEPSGAMVYGVVATFFCYGCCELIKNLGMDDALDVWGVHGMGGWIGAILLLGVFAQNLDCKDEASAPQNCMGPGEPPYASWRQLGVQTVATIACSVYSMAVTWLILKAISLCMPLKPQSLHVDLHEHHEEAYHSPVAWQLHYG